MFHAIELEKVVEPLVDSLMEMPDEKLHGMLSEAFQVTAGILIQALRNLSMTEMEQLFYNITELDDDETDSLGQTEASRYWQKFWRDKKNIPIAHAMFYSIMTLLIHKANQAASKLMKAMADGDEPGVHFAMEFPNGETVTEIQSLSGKDQADLAELNKDGADILRHFRPKKLND